MGTIASDINRPISTSENIAGQSTIADVPRERNISRLLMVYAATGLLFMLLPGTFLGVWNLFAISSQHASGSVSPSWIQAHGHAQIFGWIGTFIIGIGYYSLPKLRRITILGLTDGWVCWALWTIGVSLRWVTNTYQWHWRLALPVSAVFELIGFLIFFSAVSRHNPASENKKKKMEAWMIVVIAATMGLLITLALNLGEALYLALAADNPAFPPSFDQRFLTFTAWGFLVPFVWGFSARWLPVFLGLRPLNNRLLLLSLTVNSFGVIVALFGLAGISSAILLLSAVTSAISLRLLQSSINPAKIRGVHHTFPVFARLAYIWLIVAGLLAVWAAYSADSNGIWGASRHALTVGFLSVMVFCIGPRVLPAFAGMTQLFSTKLMFASLALLNAGCGLRVFSEIAAYQGYLQSAWSWLPVSAVVELSAIALFALNMGLTFSQRPIMKEAFWLQLNAAKDRNHR